MDQSQSSKGGKHHETRTPLNTIVSQVTGDKLPESPQSSKSSKSLRVLEEVQAIISRQPTPVNTTQIEPDHDVDDEGYARSTSTSYATSIASDIRRGIKEHGRTYAAYGQHFYGLPIDDDEQQRNDLQHCKFTLIYENQLFLSPISPEPQNILDLGTGSGIWAIDVADQYPMCSVLGIDIAATQPQWVPPNCSFEIDDVEQEWLFRKNSFDLIHAREFLFAIRDWPKLISQAYEHLKPGGYLEMAATVPEVGCDDGTVKEDSSYCELGATFFKIAEKMGVDGWAPLKWKTQLEQQGYEDVQEHVFKIPTNPWPKDKRLKRIGALEVANFLEYSQGGFERGYVHLLGGDPVQLQVMFAQVKKEIADRGIHTYVYYYNVYGRKPGATTGSRSD